MIRLILRFRFNPKQPILDPLNLTAILTGLVFYQFCPISMRGHGIGCLLEPIQMVLQAACVLLEICDFAFGL
jgi:hypothetical protein